MCGFYSIAFIEDMLAEKTFLDYTNLFAPNDYKKINIVKQKTYETRNYISDEIKHNDLMSDKYKKTCKYLNYIERLLILVSAVTGCVLISAFVSLVCIPFGITSFAIGIKICAIAAGIKYYKSIIKKKKKSTIEWTS